VEASTKKIIDNIINCMSKYVRWEKHGAPVETFSPVPRK
jgi:hypothetical protein